MSPIRPEKPADFEKPRRAHERKCRKCGCTDDLACPGGCYWVEADLCSRCVTGRRAKGERGRP